MPFTICFGSWEFQWSVLNVSGRRWEFPAYFSLTSDYEEFQMNTEVKKMAPGASGQRRKRSLVQRVPHLLFTDLPVGPGSCCLSVNTSLQAPSRLGLLKQWHYDTVITLENQDEFLHLKLIQYYVSAVIEKNLKKTTGMNSIKYLVSMPVVTSCLISKRLSTIGLST